MNNIGRIINADCRKAKAQRECLTPQLIRCGVTPHEMKYVPAGDGAELICRGEVVLTQPPAGTPRKEGDIRIVKRF